MIVLSKEAGSRIDSGRELLAAVGTHRKTLLEKLQGVFPPGVAAQTVQVVGTLSTVLEVAVEELVRAEHAHSVELGEDGPARARRDAAYDRVRDGLKALSAASETGYGDEAPAALGLDGPLPDRPADLHRYAEAAVHAARTRELPPPRYPGAIDLAPIVDQLDTDTSELGAALDEVTREKKETETTLLAKHASMDRFDRGFVATATLVSALFAVAGEKDLSRRIRPSTRRPGRTVGKARELAGGQPIPEDELVPVPQPLTPAPAAGDSEDAA